MQKVERLFAQLLEKIKVYQPHFNPTRLEEAFAFAKQAHQGQTRGSGGPYIGHPLAVASILTEYQAEEDTLIAAILHDTVEDIEHISYQTIETKFGTVIAKLVEGVTKISAGQIKASLVKESSLDKPHDVETIRKIFLESDRDIRVILIKLADRLHNMKTLSGINDLVKQRVKAEETLNIFVPVAMRIGIWKMKNDLEKEVLHYLYPEQEQEIQTFLQNIKSSQSQLIHRLIHKIEHADDKQKIQKIHIYKRSLFTLKKLLDQEKNLHPGRTFNLFICLKNEETCYATLKLIHRLFPTRTLEEDFISNPRENHYKAYHINIVTQDGHKVQLRLGTHDMYLRSMYGITHAVFQKKESHSKAKFLIPLELLSKKTKHSPEEFLEAAKSDLLQEKIEIHCDNKHYFIPEGATALDAIFHIYGAKALHTTEIFLNNKSIPFNQEITHIGVLRAEFSPRLTVEFDWFYKINTANARIAIQEALQKWNYEKKVEVGHQILQKEFDAHEKGKIELHFKKKNLDDYFEVKNINDLSALVGEGRLKPYDIFLKCFPETEKNTLQKIIDHVDNFFGKLLFRRKKEHIRFQLKSIADKKINILTRIHKLAEKFEILISKITYLKKTETQTCSIQIHCSYEQKKDFHKFQSMLEQQSGVINVKPLMSIRKRAFFLLWLITTITLWLTFPLLFHTINHLFELSLYGSFFACLMPILLANYLLFKFTKNHFLQIRNTTWIFLANIIVNFIGMGALMLYSTYKNIPLNISFIFVIFACLNAMYLYEFLIQKTHNQPRIPQVNSPKKISFGAFSGAAIAIIVLGINPIIIRHLVHDLNIPVSTTIISRFFLGGGILWIIHFFTQNKNHPKTKFTYDYLFGLMVLGILGNFILYHWGMKYTTATNAKLMENFTSIIVLLSAGLFIPDYIRRTRGSSKTEWIKTFIIVLLGSAGISFILNYFPKGSVENYEIKLFGDSIEIIATFFFAMFFLAHNLYVKQNRQISSIEIIAKMFLCAGALALPFILWEGVGTASQYSWKALSLLGFIGIFSSGLTYVLWSFVARTLDVVTTSLLFNFAVIITIIGEHLFFDLSLNILLLIGATLMIYTAVAADLINKKRLS